MSRSDCDCGPVRVRWSEEFPYHLRIAFGSPKRRGRIAVHIDHELAEQLIEKLAAKLAEAEEAIANSAPRQ